MEINREDRLKMEKDTLVLEVKVQKGTISKLYKSGDIIEIFSDLTYTDKNGKITHKYKTEYYEV